jgi:DNA repair protein RadA/Sms
MVKKISKSYVCEECGEEHSRWVGKCKACGKFNTVKELNLGSISKPKSSGTGGWAGNDNNDIVSAQDINKNKKQVVRINTGNEELNRVLGNGLTKGSMVLIGGDPGVGKSTLLIQVMSAISLLLDEKALYVTGEESLSQVVNRGERLNLDIEKLKFLSETSVESIIYQIEKNKMSVVVIDSIQTIVTESSDSVAGSPSQLRDATAKLNHYAKKNEVSIFLIGHVTKGGTIAGPKILEHMVDTVLSFEGEEGSRYRMLRALKNRFGQVNELGVFAMTDKGLKEVKNPSSLFISSESTAASGSAIMVLKDGSRPLLFEVQALVNESFLEAPMLVPIGLNYQRIRMILAVMQKHTTIKTYNQDIYVNVVGGMQVPSTETSSDLSVCFAVLSSVEDIPISKKIASFGELSLSGEIRPVPNGEDRIKEAEKHGFEYIIVPKANTNKKLIENSKIKIIPVTNISAAIEELYKIIK